MLTQKHRRLLFWCAYSAVFIWLLPRPSFLQSPLGLLFQIRPVAQFERPTWDELKQRERDLPQHNFDLPLPEGRNGRFVHFIDQGAGQEWSRQLHEMLMLANLAHKVRRCYVFHNYRWSLDQFPWPAETLSDTERKDLPRTPLSAFITGPAVGGSWDDSDAPRAISQHWWDIVCPPGERTRIEAESLWEDGVDSDDWTEPEDANILSPAWEKALNGSQRCIEVFPMTKGKDRQSQGFMIGSDSNTDVLSTWEEFRHSPIARYTTASELVLSAVEKNKVLFQTRRGRLGWTTLTADNDSNPFDRMLAVHVQRGNSFKQECMDAAEQNSSFYGWNQLPQLPDRFHHPIGPEWRRGTPENIALFIEHCYPDDDFVYRKIREAKLEHEATGGRKQPRTLDVLFLATNEKPDWQKAMKRILLLAGWGSVVTTQDLQLDSEQFEVGIAVEMELARRAAVFLGSGWSPFTSSITHRRLVGDREPATCRFF